MSDKAMAVELIDAPKAIEQVTRGEVEIQAMLAMRNPRNPERSIQRTLAEATESEETAAECFYALPRGGKTIEGASVRLCEIAARHWGNLRCGSRVVDVGDTLVTSQGYAWDLETNYVVYQERQRKITGRNGKRFTEDMIVVTANAAASIAFREAVTKTIGKTRLDKIWLECKKVAMGEMTSFAEKWNKWIAYLAKAGIDEERAIRALGKQDRSQLVQDDLGRLQGFITTIKASEADKDVIFPPLVSPDLAVPTAGVSHFGAKKDSPDTAETPEVAAGPAGPAEGDKAPQGEPPGQDVPEWVGHDF